LDQGVRLLDIGFGNGTLIIQFAQTFPNSKFVGIGPELHGIEEAKATIRQLGLHDRVAVEHAGGENLTFENEFDMVSMVVTLHEISPDVRLRVVEKTYQALKPGGHILVLDFPYPKDMEDFRNPIYDYGIMDQFYETCMGSMHLNNEEQTRILAQSGFKNIQRMAIGKGIFDFITASK
jgi:ubiquinone/menaquinone biosynthesis C-methylase UbiE